MKRAFAVVLLLIAWQARAGEYTWSAGLGGGLSRSDAWSTDGPHLVFPTWDWNTDLGFGGVPFRPGLLQFLTTAQYRSLWAGYPEGSNRSHALSYALNASLLSDFALPISLFATRTIGQFLSLGEVQRTGTTHTSTEGGTVVFRKIGYPMLRLALTRTDLDNEAFGVQATRAGSTALSLGVSHSTPRQDFSAAYDTAWNDGNYAETNYRSHAVQAQASTAITDSLRFRLSERYLLRLPTLQSPTNPRFDDNGFGAGLQWRPGERVTSGLDYNYRHSLVKALDTDELEQLGHGLQETTSYRLSEDVTVNGTANAQTITERRGGESRKGSSATGGGGLSGRRRLSDGLEVSAGGGGSLGVAKPAQGPAQLAYGANASAGITASWETARASATYSGSYQNSISGLAGSSLTQQLNLTGDALVRSTLLRGVALFSGSRRQDPFLGVSLNRTISLSLTATWSIYNAQASVGQSEGASAISGISDGLFIPASFNTRTRYATVSTGFAVPRTHIVLSLLLRTLSTEAPGRSIRHEQGESFSAGYTIGATTISLEQRFSTGGSSGIWQTGNLVLVRITRSFGGQF